MAVGDDDFAIIGYVKAIYNTSQVREIDRSAIEDHKIPGLTLMDRAARACLKALLDAWPDPGAVAVFCGSGNNAGDGFIIAGLLQDRGIPVRACCVGRQPEPGSDAGDAFAYMQQAGVPIVDASEALEGVTVVVDALLGTGISGDVRPAYQEVINQINAAQVRVLAVDLPSGLNADTGAVGSACIRADVTVTFIGRKLGLLTNDGPEFSGQVSFASLDVPEHIVEEVEPLAHQLEYFELAAALPVRHRNAHKVAHGHLVIVGGGKGMAGAVTMTAEASLYAGAGMVTVLTAETSVPVVMSRRPEIMARSAPDDQTAELLQRASAIVLGPGLGQTEWGSEMFQLALQANKPMLIDADGLNLLAESDVAARDNWVLTPHPGEARRLLGADGSVQSQRVDTVQSIRQRYGGQVLLKGAGTLIMADPAASETGNSQGQLWVNPYGNPGMSVAGMGDILSGVIGGLMVQGLPLSLATCLGCVVHSLAADQRVKAQGERGLLATELLPDIRRLLNPGS